MLRFPNLFWSKYSGKIYTGIIKDINKGIEPLPQTQVFLSLSVCNMMMQTFYILNFIDYKRVHSLKCLISTKLGCKDIGICKSEFVEKT